MVHIRWVGPMARVGHDKDAEALDTEARGRRLQQWRYGPIAIAKPEAEKAHAPAPLHVGVL